MVTTLARTTTARTQSQLARDDDHMELAQQFKTIADYTAYVVARIQETNMDLGQSDKTTMTLSRELPTELTNDESAPSLQPQAGHPVEVPSLDVPVEMAIEETEDEPRPRKEKRIKGRRRAANPDTEIEAAFRRQAELKTSFRTLARPLKLVLDEMARRTTETLDADCNAHKTATEHATVEAQLRQTLEKRKADVQRQYELQREQLKKRYEAEDYTLRKQCEQHFDNAQHRVMDHVAYDMLQIDRQRRLDEGQVDDETEDEDDIILLPHRMSYRYQRGSAIEAKFDSRSRHDLEVAQAHRHHDDRSDMRSMLQGEHDVPDDRRFTVMDSTPREAAIAKRQGVEGMHLLVNASQHVEHDTRKRKRKPASVVSNRDATSLMELASMAAKRSTQARGDMAPPTTPRRRPSQAGHRDERPTQYSLEGLQGHKRTRSDLELSSPAAKRTHLDLISPANLKKEQSMTPGSQMYRLGDVIPPYQPGEQYNRRLDHAPNGIRLESELYDRRLSNDGRPADHSTLASPFTQQIKLPPGYQDFGTRQVLQPPPMPPTAAPVNHFANGNIHRHSFPSAHFPPCPPPVSSWSTIASSPLVALPQGDAPQPGPPMSFLGRPPFMFSQPPPPPPQHTFTGGPPLLPNQYGGPMLAPAAGLYRAPQPAFAQQADRQEQTKRRNTESNAEKRFRPYHPPTQH